MTLVSMLEKPKEAVPTWQPLEKPVEMCTSRPEAS